MKTMMMLLLLALLGCGGDDTFTAEPDDDPVIVEEPTCKANVTGQLTLANGASSVQTVVANGVAALEPRLAKWPGYKAKPRGGKETA